MVSFVETATLLLKDELSAKIRTINKSLKDLLATANCLKRINIDLRINDRGLTKAAADARWLGNELRRLSAFVVDESLLSGAFRFGGRVLNLAPRRGRCSW